MCGEGKKDQASKVSARLSKQKFRSFLTRKFGPIFAEKMTNIIDVNSNSIVYEQYIQ